MTISLRRTCSLGVAMAAALTLAAPPALASERGDKAIRAFLKDTLPKGTGGTAIAVRNGRIVSCTGFGMADRAKKIPARCDTVYDLMSMTKQFTAAAILKLEMMGKLKVTDRMSRFVGPVPRDKRGITLHHLLTHTSGLIEGLGDDYDVLSRKAMLRGALKSKLLSAPGKKYRYSNLGYSVLAAIIEKASGMPYERFLAKRLFAPAGMTQTGYVLPKWKRADIALEYDEHGRSQGTPLDHPWAADGPYWNLRGNGGMLSTARDLFRYHRALQGNKVLSKRAKRKMFKPHVPEGQDNVYYGYGWSIVRLKGHGKLATHSGGNSWSLGRYTRFLDKRVMVYVTSNYAYQVGKWNLEDLDLKLLLGIANRT